LQVPYYQLSDNVEAEAYCSHLYKINIVNYVISNDSDTLVYGAELLRQQKGKQIFDHYNPVQIKSSLELSDEQFIDMCIALGSDDFDVPKVKGIGPKTAVDKIKKGKFAFTQEQEDIKKYYTSDLSGYNFTMKVSEENKNGLIDFLVGKNFKKERVEKMIKT
jgi:5'-3' exonuclease